MQRQCAVGCFLQRLGQLAANPDEGGIGAHSPSGGLCSRCGGERQVTGPVGAACEPEVTDCGNLLNKMGARISGAGSDVIWGDWAPNNPSGQTDVMYGGDGKDFIYPSHGLNKMFGGRGNDRIIAYYGHGTIDCGPGTADFVQTRENGAYKVKNCEVKRHFCSFGSKPNGDCKKPGEGLAFRQPLRLVDLLGGLVALQRGG